MAVNNCDTACVVFDVNGSYPQQVDDQRVRLRNAVNIFRMATTDAILYKLILQIQCSITQIGTSLIDLDNRLGGQSVMQIIDDLKLQLQTNRTNIDELQTNLAATNANVTTNKSLIDTALDQLQTQQYSIGALNQSIVDLSGTVGVNIGLTEVTYPVDKLNAQQLYWRVQGGTIFVSGKFTTDGSTTNKSLLLKLGSIPAEYAPKSLEPDFNLAAGVITLDSGKAQPGIAATTYVMGGASVDAGQIFVSLESATNMPASQTYIINIQYYFAH